jgi:hypothetical protein
MQDNLRIEEKTRQSSSRDKRLWSKDNNSIQDNRKQPRVCTPSESVPYHLILCQSIPSQPSKQPTYQPLSTSYPLRGST